LLNGLNEDAETEDTDENKKERGIMNSQELDKNKLMPEQDL
jgi:hypothetical protein